MVREVEELLCEPLEHSAVDADWIPTASKSSGWSFVVTKLPLSQTLVHPRRPEP